MRRIIRPKCTACRQADAVYDSAQFSSIQLCHPCSRDFSDWLLDICKRKWNPLIHEFASYTGSDFTDREGNRFKGVWVAGAEPGSHSVIQMAMPKNILDFETD